jgi:curli biogenesis system outer membrane secretion channel CsgG
LKRIAISLLACGALTAQDLELGDAARQISAEFRKKNPTIDFRSTLAVARFKITSGRLLKNSTADLVKAAFEKEFVRSVYFEVVERENLDKVISEIELRQKGLTQQKLADDILKGAEYLLVGNLTEDGSNLIVSVRLVQAASGTVVTTAQARAPLDSAEQDYSNASVWEFDNANAGAPKLSQQRVLVTAYGSGGMTIFKPALLAEFLIYSRLSVTASIGYMYSTLFKPFIFEAGGERHWAESEDINGTFAKYQNYNFARRIDGRPV